MTCAWVEPYCGIAGDMTVAALLDLGWPLEELREGLARLPLEGYEIAAERTLRGPFRATGFSVAIEEEHPHRGLADVRAILAASDLPARVLARSERVFELLATAEAKAHGVTVEEVHFHEVGAVDAIVDVVGAALGMEHFGVDRIFCSPVRVGTGEVECRHGKIPVPAPATLHLLAGFPMDLAPGEGETATPTGAALLAAWAEPLGEGRVFTPERTGYGAGSRQDTARPNVLRVTLGETEESADAETVVEISANLDDQSPEGIAHALGRLLEKGALDAWAAPVVMKKGRPGVVLSLLAREADAALLEEVLFRETTTFGLRRRRLSRRCLTRRHEEVRTPYGRVRVKVGLLGTEVVARSPEYEDCARRARESGAALKDVYEAAIRAL